jgi:rod shape-determining protein MreC
LTNLSRRFLFSPVLHVSNAIDSWWRLDVSSLFNGPKISAQNRRLQNEVATLMDQNRDLADQAAENLQLRALLGFKARDPRNLLPAEVLALKPFAERDSAIFSRGIDDKVTVKEPAIDENGNLVGQVTSVTSDTCDVMLLTDTLSSAGARIVPAGALAPPVTPVPSPTTIKASPAIAATVASAAVPAAAAPAQASAATDATAVVGICVGDRSSLLSVTDLPPDADVSVGDQVVTSGLGGVYPRDIPIGRVVQVNFDKTRYLKTAVVAPATDFNHLQEGFLLR